MIKAKQTILFQGDSITDATRNRDRIEINNTYGLGPGYAGMISSSLLSERPKDGLKFLNRGISGNRVTDLLARWRPDAILLKPNVISILIGVNDTWHKFKTDTGTSLDIYENVYRLLLGMTRKELPATRFILCEPFGLVCGEFKKEWVAELKRRSAIVQKLAKEFDAVFVPFQKMFDDLCKEAPADYWLPDGVHPSSGGHARMAQLWKKCVLK